MNSQEERMRIAKIIADLRKAKGITQVELAERSGVGRTHIAGIEKGNFNIQIDTLAALADAMNCRLDIVNK